MSAFDHEAEVLLRDGCQFIVQEVNEEVTGKNKPIIVIVLQFAI
jgi:hypothetical protein